MFTHAGRRAATASVTVAAVLLIYYGPPIYEADQGMMLAARIVILAVGLGLLGWRIPAAASRDTPYQRHVVRLFAGIY
ncbi:hypothetical protein [Frankia gtarii]|uniref:hypothetical protein n=1 Tax=Frankia gtarii TaxID=2950102 RepID=UPI0021C124A1|nr:hypothetical protein [Frankia gtarii]